MSRLRVLVVCTGNTCRSPMAEAILRARLADDGVSAEVRSVGTLGWAGRPATSHTVAVVREMGLDLDGHVSRKIGPEDLDVDLVVAMTRIHAGAVIARDASLRSRVFLPAEFARLAGDARLSTGGWRDQIATIGQHRRGDLVGRPGEEIADPAGEPIDVYRSTLARLDRDLSGLVVALRSSDRPESDSDVTDTR